MHRDALCRAEQPLTLQPRQAGHLLPCCCQLTRVCRRDQPQPCSSHPSDTHHPAPSSAAVGGLQGSASGEASPRPQDSAPLWAAPVQRCAAQGRSCSLPRGFEERLRCSGPGTLTAGMGRVLLGALRLAPANTFRKYGFLINRVKRRNFPAGAWGTCTKSLALPPGAAGSGTGTAQRAERVHLLPTTTRPAQFETSLPQRALGKIIMRKRELSKANTSNP